jgi:hypothetical protein
MHRVSIITSLWEQIYSDGFSWLLGGPEEQKYIANYSRHRFWRLIHYASQYYQTASKRL